MSPNQKAGEIPNSKQNSSKQTPSEGSQSEQTMPHYEYRKVFEFTQAPNESSNSNSNSNFGKFRPKLFALNFYLLILYIEVTTNDYINNSDTQSLFKNSYATNSDQNYSK